MYALRQELGQNEDRAERAEKSLNIIKNNLAKKKI